METYNGHVRTPADAIILFEACRIGLLPRVQRRLSEKERQSIKSGSVFVWDEREAGMRRWTDGKSWSASRVSGSFLTYREMEGKRGGSSFNDKQANRDGVPGNDQDSDGGPDGYRYKPDGLMKQSFSITTTNGQHLHLISYFTRSTSQSQNLQQPTNDPQLRHIRPEKGMYPESTVHEQSNHIPAVTRGPMSSPGYTSSPHQPADMSPYGRGPHGPPPYMMGYPHPGWAPPSPMHTPPPHYSPYYHPSHHGAPPGYPGHSPLQQMHYPPHPSTYAAPPPMTAFDRPPPPLSNNGLPPPPPQHYQQPIPPMQHSGYHPGYYSQYQPPPIQHQPPYPPPPQHQHQQMDEQHQQSQQRQPEYGAQTARPEMQSQPKESRQDSHQSQQKYENIDPQMRPGAQQPAPTATASSATTIPSISSLINGADDVSQPPRPGTRSPTSATRGGPSDIPSHKLGFEANRDMQALRHLDRATFK